MTTKPWRTVVRSRALVSTLGGSTFRGVLWDVNPEFLVLRDAEMMGPEGEAVPVDGELIVERRQVEYVQVLR